MTDARFPPPEWQGIKWLPEKPFPWSVILSPLAVVLVGVIVAGVLLSLPDIAEAIR